MKADKIVQAAIEWAAAHETHLGLMRRKWSADAFDRLLKAECDLHDAVKDLGR